MSRNAERQKVLSFHNAEDAYFDKLSREDLRRRKQYTDHNRKVATLNY